jgi:hypothetical protein
VTIQPGSDDLDELRAHPELLGVHDSYRVEHDDVVHVVTPVTADLRVTVRGERWARYYPRLSQRGACFDVCELWDVVA